MHMLKFQFQLLSIAGIWMPVGWTDTNKKIAYVFYSVFCIGLILMTCTAMFGHLLTAVDYSDFCERLFLLPTNASTVQKIFIVTVYRKDMVELGSMFLRDDCLARNANETRVLEKHEGVVRALTLACFVLVDLTMLNLLSLPILTQSYANHTLPLKVWLPYSLESDGVYWFTYVCQSMGTLLVGVFATGSTLMLCGMMYMVCAQYEILGLRFREIPEGVRRLRKMQKPESVIREYERICVGRNVRHHVYIFEIGRAINDTFKSVILQHFLFSSIVLSTSIYQLLTRPEKDLEFLMVLFYLSCVLVEFLLYCYFGNELTLESVNFRNSVYAIDWEALSPSTGRDLIVVIARCTRPIWMCCGHFIVLTLQSFIRILKVSYSVFNVLTMSSD